MDQHSTNDPLKGDDFYRETPEPLKPGMGLAIGASGPAWFPPRHAAAENFNPYHDSQGRFTDSDHATGGKSGGDPSAGSTKGKSAANEYKLRYPVTAGAFAQGIKTSECAPAAALEILAQIVKLRTADDEPVPIDSKATMWGLKTYINEYREKIGRTPIDFSSYKPGVGASFDEVNAVLGEKFNLDSKRITTEQIPGALQYGPILVATGTPTDGHAQVILGVAGPHSYYVYNPLGKFKREETINESQIVIANFRDKAGKLVKGPAVYALSPRKRGCTK